MLHIVNGDSFAAKLASAVPGANIMVWRESLYEGPLSVEFTDTKTRTARARYFAERGVPEGEFERSTAQQEKELEEFRSYDEVILWFEHDLFDQAMLIYLLQWFARQELGKERLSLICIDSYPGIHPFKGLGSLTVQQTASLMNTWKAVSEDQIELAVRAWDAYAGNNPMKLVELIEGHSGKLPFLQRAFECHLRRLPSLHNGLSAVQECALRLIQEGVVQPESLFGKVSEIWLDYGLGDVQFWGLLRELAACEQPLIGIKGGELPGYGQQPRGLSLEGIHIGLTPFGRNVLSMEADHVTTNGISCWFGGIYLNGYGPTWRWDEGGDKLIYK
ncbi:MULTISPECIES: DUF1835 domain-containing protein [Paenibacillus]|uniref:DUF1835 domain-containing protein n=1 Tax=Paenibacillus TaxID=44249 RepID=UPI0022B8FA8E|nr:DUF1835 domain-containing protein [Paenibacillus caseinilyticus]MCZ8523548.1 DUF1835 domain-containing protein [Paenibacillus caseinilyticus]